MSEFDLKLSIGKILILIGLITVMSSCHDNSIYFDIENQMIVSENKSNIINLYISDDNDMYRFSVKPNMKGTNTFSLVYLNSNYQITDEFDNEIRLDSFKLNPEHHYRIQNCSNGDASVCEIFIETDKNGKVILALN